MEYGWLVEYKDDDRNPQYLSGFDVFPTRYPHFSLEHVKAIRFVRREDASKVINELGLGKCIAVEHAWG